MARQEIATKNFGTLFRESLNEFGDKFTMILKSFFAFYFAPFVVFMILLITAMLISYLQISGNAVSDFAMAGAEGDFFNMADLPFSATAVFIIIALMVVAFIILNVLLSISYIKISFYKNEKSFVEIFRDSSGFFWRYLGYTIVFFVFIAALFILLIIPGIIFLVYWAFSSIILVGENKGIIQSLRESKNVVKGRWWNVFGYLLLIILISIGVSIVGGVIPFIGLFISNLIVAPFAIIFLKNYYLDLKSSKVS